MISYAQNHEDVLLNRIFRSQRSGFYIDVGAGHPCWDSVTRHFYDLGWQGINIEPRSGTFVELVRQRPRDLNLNVCVSEQAGSATFYEVDVRAVNRKRGDAGGLSTLDPSLAGQHRVRSDIHEYQVEVTTLTAICEAHAPSEISFVKIDVEGHEGQVIRSLDWRRFRPRVAVVEATEPCSTRPSHQAWEPVLLDANYRYATFDGLNRYYVRAEDEPLLEHFQTPVNVLDEYVPYEVVRLRRELSGPAHAAVRWTRSLAGRCCDLLRWPIGSRIARPRNPLAQAGG